MIDQPNFQLPFTGEWLVFWGGDTPELNHHHDSTAQRYAFNFVIVDADEKFHTSDGTQNNHYYSFGKDVLAPRAGTVIEASDGVRDNEPGETNPYSLIGNHVIIRHDDDTFSLIAHLKNGSISIKEGTVVEQGQTIAQCGNSGNSSNAHLHYQLQSSATFARFIKGNEQEDVAHGLKVSFTNVVMRRTDVSKSEIYYSPVKGDFIRNKEYDEE